MSSNCITNALCSKTFGPSIQTAERSSSDYAQFKAAAIEYTYIQNNQTPSFASHRDYLKWKRMNAQLNSAIRVVSSIGIYV